MSLTDSIVALLPQGEAWPRAATSNLWSTVNLFSAAMTRVLAWCDYALADTFPITAKDSLPEWMASLELPNPTCPPLTASQQKQQFFATLTDLGGCTPSYFISYALSLGYEIEITELQVPRANECRVGCQINTLGADHVWRVTILNVGLDYFRADVNRADDPLSVLTGSTASLPWLEWTFGRLKPSQTICEIGTS